MPHNQKTRSKSSATEAKLTRAKRKSRRGAVGVAKRYATSAGSSAAKMAVSTVKVVTWQEAATLLETSQEIKRMLEALKGEIRSQGAIEASAYAPSSRARALLQGVKIAEADLKEAGGAFDLEQVQTILHHVSRQAVEKRVKDGSILAVPGPNNRRRYPTIQFTREGVVRGLKEVQEALPTRNPWAVLNFLVRPDHRLDGRKPIEVLRNGDVDLVVSAARGMGEQGG